ncbi:hypothetical protein RR46_01838 [Papilio xuthus]|uniref:Uncharacterized protein n=1 Tax=Papilio xuthus TaxID=66420 RepID=A0A194QKA2_PAPXU|nr:hypothetical protein RR46_01838 [Papilio xuthus]
MSSALVRQALALVEGEENSVQKQRKGKKKKTQPQELDKVRDLNHPYRRTNKKTQKETKKSEKEIEEENIKKLLALSKPTANSAVAKKIVERAVKRKPLLDKIKVKKDDHKSILFPGESYETFEEEYFCS